MGTNICFTVLLQWSNEIRVGHIVDAHCRLRPPPLLIHFCLQYRNTHAHVQVLRESRTGIYMHYLLHVKVSLWYWWFILLVETIGPSTMVFQTKSLKSLWSLNLNSAKELFLTLLHTPAYFRLWILYNFLESLLEKEESQIITMFPVTLSARSVTKGCQVQFVNSGEIP